MNTILKTVLRQNLIFIRPAIEKLTMLAVQKAVGKIVLRIVSRFPSWLARVTRISGLRQQSALPCAQPQASYHLLANIEPRDKRHIRNFLEECFRSMFEVVEQLLQIIGA